MKDKTLGCWCKPLPCHGDVLAYLTGKHAKRPSDPILMGEEVERMMKRWNNDPDYYDWFYKED